MYKRQGEHLHFQMEYKDKTIDPKPILDYINEVIRTVKAVSYTHLDVYKRQAPIIDSIM